MGINFSELKNDFYHLGKGAVITGSALFLGYSIYKSGPMGFSAKIIKDRELLAASIFIVNAVASEILHFRLKWEEDSLKLILTSLSFSFISVGSLAYASYLGYRVPAYILTAMIASMAALVLREGSSEILKGLKSLHLHLVKQQDNPQPNNPQPVSDLSES